MSESFPPKQKTILYRRAVFAAENGDPSVTLESLLRAALKKKKKVSSRMQEIGDGDTRLINYFLMHELEEGEIFGCEFFSYKKGEGQSSLAIDPELEELPVGMLTAGEGKEFVEGSVYFAVRGNHVVLFKSRSLGTLELEQHLNWLIYSKSQALDGNYMYLSEHISEAAKKNIKGAKGIRLTSPVEMVSVERGTVGTNVEDLATEEAVAEHRSVKVKPAGPVWEAFKKFITTVVDFDESFNVENLAKIPDLQVSMSLEWKGRRKESEGEILDAIATQMRHIDDQIDYAIQTNDGYFSPKSARNTKVISVKWTGNNRPDFEHLFGRIADWLVSLLNDGKVDP